MRNAHEAALVAGVAAESSGREQAQAGWIAAGGILGAVAASSCCILPLVLFGLGVGGAWIGNLTALAPYQPVFIAITLGFLGYGYYAVFWKPRRPALAPPSALAPCPTAWSRPLFG